MTSPSTSPGAAALAQARTAVEERDAAHKALRKVERWLAEERRRRESAEAAVAQARVDGAAEEREKIVATLYDWADNDVDLTPGDVATLRLAVGRLERGSS